MYMKSTFISYWTNLESGIKHEGKISDETWIEANIRGYSEIEGLLLRNASASDVIAIQIIIISTSVCIFIIELRDTNPLGR